MLKLVFFQDKPFFNGSDIAQTVSEHFYLKGFPFDQTVIAMPDDLASIKATAVADKGNYYVFLNPTEYVIGENIRSIKQIALEKDLIAVIGELERVTGKSYGNCVLKAFGADKFSPVFLSIIKIAHKIFLQAKILSIPVELL